MAISPLPVPSLPEPPWPEFHAELERLAAALAAAGDETGAERLAAATRRWWLAQLDWAQAVAERLRMHHEINNALVGVSGNAQLLMMGQLGTDPRGRERLQVILRESGRITDAARVLGELRAQLKAEVPNAPRPRNEGESEGDRHVGSRR